MGQHLQRDSFIITNHAHKMDLESHVTLIVNLIALLLHAIHFIHYLREDGTQVHTVPTVVTVEDDAGSYQTPREEDEGTEARS